MADTKHSSNSNTAGLPWQRLSPAAIAFFIVGSVAGLIKGVLEAVAWGAAAYTFIDSRLVSLSTIIPIILLVLIARPVLQYLTFRFRFTENAFQVKSGIVSRKRLTLSFDRIQSTNIIEPFYFRPFRLVNLMLESAGSSDEEVVLPGITAAQAKAIKQQILLGRQKEGSQAPAQENARKNLKDYRDQAIDSALTHDEDTQVLVHRPIPELIKYGISNNRALAALGVISAAFWQLDDSIIFSGARNIFETIIGVLPDSVFILSIFGFLLSLLGLLIFGLLSSLGAIIRHYNYTLYTGSDRFTRAEGLIEKKESHVARTKIQSLRLSQPAVAMLLKRFHGTIKQVKHSRNSNQKSDANIIIPSLTGELAEQVSSDILSASGLPDLPLNSIHADYRWKTMAVEFGVPSLVAAVVLNLIFGSIGLVALTIPFLALPAIELRRRRFGYQMTDDHMVIRHGFIGTDLTLFDLHKIQSVRIIQSPGHRRSKLATIRFNLAGTRTYLPFIPLEMAEHIRETCLHAAETNVKSWM